MDEKYIKQNKYFEFRKVTPEDYFNYKIPKWIENELANREAKILDFGCGFGQNLIAPHKFGFKNIYGNAIEFLTDRGF